MVYVCKWVRNSRGAGTATAGPGVTGAGLGGSLAAGGVAVDGGLRPGTAAALKRFQAANHLAVTGVAHADDFALNALEPADGSTAHFEWREFTANDGTGFGSGTSVDAHQHVDSRLRLAGPVGESGTIS